VAATLLLVAVAVLVLRLAMPRLPVVLMMLLRFRRPPRPILRLRCNAVAL